MGGFLRCALSTYFSMILEERSCFEMLVLRLVMSYEMFYFLQTAFLYLFSLLLSALSGKNNKSKTSPKNKKQNPKTTPHTKSQNIKKKKKPKKILKSSLNILPIKRDAC